MSNYTYLLALRENIEQSRRLRRQLLCRIFAALGFAAVYTAAVIFLVLKFKVR